jgi:hypothetical protein
MRNEKGQFIKGYSRIVSDETRRKISETCKQRGVGKWMEGRALPAEIKQKISLNNPRYWKGRKRGVLSEETRHKISQALIGRPASPKTLKRMAGLNKGKYSRLHPCWVENKKHPFHKAIRETHKYREWRFKVFSRDNFTCVLCRMKGGYIEADHHPKRFIDIINDWKIRTIDQSLKCKELWNINNGRTLCLKCHKKIHSIKFINQNGLI